MSEGTQETEKRAEDIRITEVRDVLTELREGIKARARAFDRGMRQAALEARARMEAEQDAIWQAQGKKVHYRDAEIAEMERREKGSPSAEILDKIDKFRDHINHADRYYNDYQVGAIHSNMCRPSPLLSVLGFLDRFSESRDGLDTTNTVAIWGAVMTSIDPMKEAPPKLPATWALRDNDANKTDQEGKPYYFPVGPDGLPRADFDPKSLSMTSGAVKARRRKYEGPDRSAAEFERDLERQEKARQKAVEGRIALKNKQRQDAWDERDKQIAHTNADMEQMRKERAKQRERDNKQ